MVPTIGIEPIRENFSTDFKSVASTNSAKKALLPKLVSPQKCTTHSSTKPILKLKAATYPLRQRKGFRNYKGIKTVATATVFNMERQQYDSIPFLSMLFL